MVIWKRCFIQELHENDKIKNRTQPFIVKLSGTFNQASRFQVPCCCNSDDHWTWSPLVSEYIFNNSDTQPLILIKKPR